MILNTLHVHKHGVKAAIKQRTALSDERHIAFGAALAGIGTKEIIIHDPITRDDIKWVQQKLLCRLV